MSEPLRDFRGKLSPLGWCWVEAVHRATGRDQSEIVRELVHEWALAKEREAIEAQRLKEAEGIVGKSRDNGDRR